MHFHFAFPFTFRLHASVVWRLKNITLVCTRYFWRTFSLLIYNWYLTILITSSNCASLLSFSELWMFSAAGPLPILWTGDCLQSVQRTWGLLRYTHWALLAVQVQRNVEGKSCAFGLMWKPYTAPREEQQPDKSQSSRSSVSGTMVWSPLHPKLPTSPREGPKE